jgi:hypothetical protein
MRRRTFLGAGLIGAAMLARPALVRAQAATTLKFGFCRKFPARTSQARGYRLVYSASE